MSNTPSLLPCPFCGSTRLTTNCMTPDDVACLDCDALATNSAAWNRRTPQPVVREPLTPERIEEICAELRNTVGCSNTTLARAIEAEVRKQDDELIQQLVEALEDLAGAGEEAWSEERPCVRIGKEVATAARARLGEKA